ncbi:hypothetical protein V6N12_059837 [Hibiscus sabdariffa]|uniref:Uncharacterized protein n=1 Tax=Hibiscus sabdariffa TaxID=183260 RepID=A0ABR2AD41_9ROSI
MFHSPLSAATLNIHIDPPSPSFFGILLLHLAGIASSSNLVTVNNRGMSPSPKLFPLQYERHPTLCRGYGITGHSLEFCSTFKPMLNTKVQYDDWIRYIPPKKQEAIPCSKGIIRYLNGASSCNPKTTINGKTLNIPQPIEEVKVPNMVVDVESTNDQLIPWLLTPPPR